MCKPFIFVPLLANRARRVILCKHLRCLTKKATVNSAIERICLREKYHATVINAVHHPVDGYGGLLPCLPLAGKVVWLEDPILVEANSNVLLDYFAAAHLVPLTAVSPITRGNPENVDDEAGGVRGVGWPAFFAQALTAANMPPPA